MCTSFAILFAISVGPVSSSASESPACLDENGDPVDFWYAMKYPNGWDYAYMANGNHLQKASVALDDEKSVVSRTLNQLYERSSSLSFALWNDEHSDGKKVKGPRAHAKGALALLNGEGFWLTHSLPQFPQEHTHASVKNSYGVASNTYGQSFICITIEATTLKTIGSFFDLNWPSVYDAQDNSHAGEDFTKWAIDQTHCSDCDSLAHSFKSKGGQTFTGFAKSGNWEHDLYDEVVAPHFRMSFLSNTWQNGIGKQASYCGHGYTVENVVSVNMLGIDYTSTEDHSKWLVSSTGGHVFCVGDLNRQDGQRTRGGGTICIQSAYFWEQMVKVVNVVENCSKLEHVVV